MAITQRRRGEEQPAQMNEDLTQPLLDPLQPPRLSLLHRLWHRIVSLWHDTLDYLYWGKLWGLRRRRPLSSLEVARLESLRQRVAAAFDPTLPRHREHLERLWVAAFPDHPFPEDVRSPQWKVMGWQGMDPSTDFRGGGFLSLELLVHFAEERREEFMALMWKKEGARSEWEYPFAAAGVNVAFMLAEVLELRDPNRLPSSPAALNFLRIVACTDDGTDKALETLFVETLKTVDRVWLEKDAVTYMEFQIVMREVRRRVEATLGRWWVRSVADIAALSGIP